MFIANAPTKNLASRGVKALLADLLETRIPMLLLFFILAASSTSRPKGRKATSWPTHTHKSTFKPSSQLAAD